MAFTDGKKYFVFGLGLSGRAVADLLAADDREVFVFDENPGAVDDYARVSGAQRARKFIRPDEVGAPETALMSCDRMVLSPGVPMDHRLVRLARDRGVAVDSEIEAAFHYTDAEIVAVTGTNGKSTTVNIIGAILKAAGIRSVVAGNVGKPLAAVVKNGETYDVIVLELSSFQLDAISEFKADVSALLNITSDHLDRYHNSFEEYVASKKRILNRADRDTWFIYNDDDVNCRGIADEFRGRKAPISSLRRPVGPNACFLARGEICRSWNGVETKVLHAKDFIPIGVHNLENAMAAVGVASAMDTPLAHIRQGLRLFRPLPHRMEPVGTVAGVNYINDSKATNVDATVKSLIGLEGSAVLILGGKDKGGDFKALVPHLGRVRKTILIGEATGRIREALDGKCDLEEAADMAVAVGLAAKHAKPGDTVLLAPACASFDMFDDYQHRGEVFRTCVKELKPDSQVNRK